MKKIEKTQLNTQITEKELGIRANYISWIFGLDKDKVIQALSRLMPTLEAVGDATGHKYYEWNPDLFDVLDMTRPEVILNMFLSEDLDTLRKWQEITTKLTNNHRGYGVGLEELCRWDAEQYFLVD